MGNLFREAVHIKHDLSSGTLYYTTKNVEDTSTIFTIEDHMLKHMLRNLEKLIFFFFGNQLIGLVGWMFTNGLGDLGSIPGRVIPKTFKMVLDTSLLNTQQYKVGIKGKVEQSKERSSALPYTSV